MGKWPRRLVVFAIIVAAYFSAGEAFRAHARAALEEDMRANFEKLQCPPDQVQGDVCLAYPDEGRCISGEYIDYRMVWRRVYFEWGATRLIQREYERLGNDRQKLANWLACQGFGSNHNVPRSDEYPVGVRAGGPIIWNTAARTISMQTRWRSGFGAVNMSTLPPPLRTFQVGFSGGIAVRFAANDKVEVRVGKRGYLAK